MKKIKKMSIVLIILSLLCMSIETTAFANINENNTALHKLWTELSEKQRLNTIEPLPYNVDINDSIKASNFSNILISGFGSSINNILIFFILTFFCKLLFFIFF